MSVFVTEWLTLGALDLVSVIEVRAVRELDADPDVLGVPELLWVTFGSVAVIVGLPIAVRDNLGFLVELDDALDVLDDCKVLVWVKVTLLVGLDVEVPVTVLVGILDLVTVGDAVPVLLDAIVLVGLTEAVLVFELVVVAVLVRVIGPVLELGGDNVWLGLADWVLDAAADLVNDVDAELVLDCPIVLELVGEVDCVLELVVVDVDVLVRGGVLDWWDVPELVFELRELIVRPGELDEDFEELLVLVEVIELVVVLVVVVEGLTKAVGLALRVMVVVLVDVFDWVLVDVETMIFSIRIRPSPILKLVVGGLKAMVPIADSNKSQRMPIYI